MNQNQNQRVFDQSICFTFHRDWLETICNFETDNDKQSVSYQLFRAIASYSLHNESPNFDSLGDTGNTLKAVWPIFAGQIDKSVAYRKQQFEKEKPTKKQQEILDRAAKSPESSYQDIANATGSSKSHVSRTLSHYGQSNSSNVEPLQEAENDLPF